MIFSYQGAAIDYEVHGDGIPILFLHGFPSDRRSMLGCMEPIMAQRAGFQRIYLDLPGLGRSRAPMDFASADRVLELLLAFIDEVAPGPFLLSGYSYGGYLAQGIAARIPLRLSGLLLLCPVVYPEHARRTLPPPEPHGSDDPFLRTLTDSERELFLTYMVVANAETYSRYRNELYPGFTPGDPTFTAELARNYGFTQVLSPPVFSGPMLLLVGRQDSCVGYRDQLGLLERYPHSTFALLDQAGHNLQIDQPGLFESLVSRWLDRVESKGAPR